MQNNEIYEAFRAVPKEAQKTIQGGNLNGKTDINPMWRIKSLTAQFGPAGFGWYTKVTEHWQDEKVIDGKTEIVAWVRLELYVNMGGKWSMPIEGIGGSKYAGKGRGTELNDEAFKMAETDAISVACKKLGMGADIYWATDSTKYTQGGKPTQVKEAAAAPQANMQLRPVTMSDTKVIDWLRKCIAAGNTREECEAVTMRRGLLVPTALWDQIQEGTL